MHVLAGLAGLLLIALGAAMPELMGTWAFSLLLIPSGTLLCGGTIFLAREREGSTWQTLGLGLAFIALLAIDLLAFQTAAPFFGLRNAAQLRVFRVPLWRELLELHLAWTLTAVVAAIGFGLICRRSIERDMLVGLAVFLVFPTIGLISRFGSMLPR
jgi:hypothetical protein